MKTGRPFDRSRFRVWKVKGSILLAVGLVVVMLVLSASAVASRGPSLSWTLPQTASENSGLPFSWTARHPGRRHRLVVQRQEGTTRSWQTVMQLRTRSGSAELPGLPLGTYRLRLADLSGHRVLVQETRGVGVFGEVPFSTLVVLDRKIGVYTTSTGTFPYVAEIYNYQTPAFTDGHNHCQSVHITFVPANGAEPGIGTVTVVQESRDPVSASAPLLNTFGPPVAQLVPGSLEAQLVPGQSWSVNTSGTHDAEPEFFINGSAVCDSTAPFT